MEQRREPVIEGESPLSRLVHGTFYRAVDPVHRASALSGSRAPGRYSPPDVPTLYLSASREGVAAAMIAHSNDRASELEVVEFEVRADGIADLRSRDALLDLGIDPEAAAADWQQPVLEGRVPPSWEVREALERHGANGLIDPSRKAPGLWHLTLFSWNRDGAPAVRDCFVSNPEWAGSGRSNRSPTR